MPPERRHERLSRLIRTQWFARPAILRILARFALDGIPLASAHGTGTATGGGLSQWYAILLVFLRVALGGARSRSSGRVVSHRRLPSHPRFVTLQNLKVHVIDLPSRLHNALRAPEISSEFSWSHPHVYR